MAPWRTPKRCRYCKCPCMASIRPRLGAVENSWTYISSPPNPRSFNSATAWRRGERERAGAGERPAHRFNSATAWRRGEPSLSLTEQQVSHRSFNSATAWRRGEPHRNLETRGCRLELQFGHGLAPWRTQPKTSGSSANAAASIRPRLGAVENFQQPPRRRGHRIASIRPRLGAVENTVRADASCR